MVLKILLHNIFFRSWTRIKILICPKYRSTIMHNISFRVDEQWAEPKWKIRQRFGEGYGSVMFHK